ncbi:MAG TPA: oxygenase MpaB family protein, partial [Solirubrobacteraceae bacterium]|nr:oxygenase MpaB family protein [Solirubrobacteraceae bacterium]
MAMGLIKRDEVKPHQDYGFFGPDSVTWKVWTYPTSLTIGFQRAVVVEELDPALIAAVDATGDVYSRPRTRYDRTLRYFALISLGDSRSAIKASDVLVKVHAKAVGTEPLSGNRYDANDPKSQLWIHLTAWHSILYAYERYGPGRLSESEEARYWEECAIAAELQTCDPDDVPRSREGIREYFEYMRPRLAGSEAAQKMMHHLLNAEVMMPPMPPALRPLNWVVNKALRSATVATMPQWMRKLGGLR